MITVHSDMQQRNVEMTKSMCFEVFKCAEDRLQVEDCTFCFTGFIPFLYKNQGQWFFLMDMLIVIDLLLAFQVAEECFAKDKKASSISANLQEKVINHWYR
jgi:hypothetical protein